MRKTSASLSSSIFDENKKKNPLLLGLPVSVGREDRTGEVNKYRTTRKTFNLDNLQTNHHHRKISAHRGSRPLTYSGDSHLITVAPTGSGKGRSVIIPNLLTYPGPVVVIDPKGENYAVTARRRKEMGHKVIRLDPFGVINARSDGLNPMDIFELDNADVETDSQMLAELLAMENKGSQEPFWDISACGLLSGLIADATARTRKSDRHLDTVRVMLMSGTFSEEEEKSHLKSVYPGRFVPPRPSGTVVNLAKQLDSRGKKMNRMAYDEMASFIYMPDKTLGSVLASAQSFMKAFLSERVIKTLKKSSFSLSDIVHGKPLSIYLIIPPDKLRSHRPLLKLWVGTLLKAITSRKYIPERRTLFLLDECAQLGNFPFLETVITLCRGYGLQAWSFWQDIGQIRQLYPTGWETMLNNCSVFQIFGAKNYMVASEFASIIGTETDSIRSIRASEQILVMDGDPPVRAARYDYLRDKQFYNSFDPNPLYKNIGVK